MDYLLEVKRRLGHIDLGLVARRSVPLESLYAEAPSSSILTIEVQQGHPVRWMITDTDPQTTQSANELLRSSRSEALAPLYRFVEERISSTRMLLVEEPYSAPVFLSPMWHDGVKPEGLRLSILNCLSLFPRLVVTGPPGSGKTTFGRYLTASMADSLRHATPQTMGHFAEWNPRPRLPIFLELRALVDFAEWPDDQVTGIKAESVLEFLEATYLRNAPEHQRREFREMVCTGDCVFVLDGLDEVRLPPSVQGRNIRRDQLTYFLDLLEREFTPSRILVTSRDYAYSFWNLSGFVHMRLATFGLPETYALSLRLLKFVDQIPSRELDTYTRDLVSRMQRLVPQGLRERPLFVALLAGVYARRVAAGNPGLPSKPTDLYEESVALLLSRWAQGPNDSLLDRLGCDLGELRERLEAIAYLGQRGEARAGASPAASNEAGFSDVVLLRELVSIPGKVNYNEIIGYLNRETGLLVSPSPGRYLFAHRSFQEYLAACHIQKLGPGSVEWAQIPADIEAAPVAWREVFRTLGVLLLERGGNEDLWGLVDLLLSHDNPSGGVWATWLATTYCDELLRGDPAIGRRNILLLRDVLGAIEGLRSHPGDLPLLERCRLLETRARLRVSGGYEPALPDSLEWCDIPGGSVQLGLLPEDETRLAHLPVSGAWIPKRELSGEEHYLEAFRISRFPITRRQFAEFLQDVEGYCCNETWRPEHLPFRHPALHQAISDPFGSESPALPRTEVSWFDSIAFCDWLTRKLGVLITLPTEPQWERAARGLDGRLFPWGDDMPGVRCNSQEAGLGGLSAVGAFSPWVGFWGDLGPCDMAGNVWEWCSTICEIEGGQREFAYPYRPEDGRESMDPVGDALRIVRGGCYVSPPHQVMTTFRGRDKPNLRMLRQGFRIAWVI